MGDLRRIPPGGRVLGMPAEITLTEITVVPALQIEVLDSIGTIGTTGPVLRVVDFANQRALCCPITPAQARQYIAVLTPLAAADQIQGGENGYAAVHEQ